MIPPSLLDRYRFFRAHGGGRVGYSAIDAWTFAATERLAEARGLSFTWEEEDEAYEDVYGEPLPADCLGPFWVACWRPEDMDPRGRTVHRRCTADPILIPCGRRGAGHSYRYVRGVPLGSLGMVTLSGPDDPYRRVVQAELALEALEMLDAIEAEEARRYTAARVTFASEGLSP